jgi:hypothetical protein
MTERGVLDGEATTDEATTAEGIELSDPPTVRRRPRRPKSMDRTRYVRAVTIGIVAALIPFLWILWDVADGAPKLFRKTYPGNDFYDLQTRAMFHGHLYVPKGTLGIEGFIHNGHTYTYFGIFPSLVRMPIMLLTHRFDGRLTAPSMLLGWLVAAVFCALLVWRVRFMMRGPVALGRMEAASYGLLLATMMGGSVFIFLASEAWAYHEDLVWSVALTVGSMFALLGVMERPSRRRIALAGVLVLFASLNRLPTGYACIVGALLVAGWLALGYGGQDNRRWVVPMLVAALVPLIALTVVNELKFGVAFGVPLKEQVFTRVNAHRRAALAATGGKGYGPEFLPSTLLAYLWPGGIRLTPIFPFITLPAEPARAVGHVVFDRNTRTASLTDTMPLLFLLSCWGVFAAFRRRRLGRGSLMRVVLFASALGFGTILIFDYISDRYVADFLPFLLVGSAVGLVDLWGRTHNWRRGLRRLLVGALLVLTVLSMVVNVAVASTPQDSWTIHRAAAYVRRQVKVSNFIGVPLTENIMHGRVLPTYAPADKLFVVGDCRALYLSIGEKYKTFPAQNLEKRTWYPIERPAGVVNRFSLWFHGSLATLTQPIPLMAIGSNTVSLVPDGKNKVRFDLTGPHRHDIGRAVRLKGGYAPAQVIIDPYLRVLIVSARSTTSLVAKFPTGQPKILPRPHTPGSPLAVDVVTKKKKSTSEALCRKVLSAGKG